MTAFLVSAANRSSFGHVMKLPQWRRTFGPRVMTVDNDLGVALSRKGAHLEALEVLREAILRRPDDALAYYNLGNAHVALGNRADAVSAFEQSVALRPDFAFAWYNLGKSLCVLEKMEGAAAAFRRAAM